MKAFSSPRRHRPFPIIILNLIFYLLVCAAEAQPQARRAFTLNEITELLKSGVSATRLVQLVESHGVAFDLDDRTLLRLKEDGATSAVLSSVKKMSVRFAEEKKRIGQEQEKVAKRLREEEAKRRETKEKEQRRLAELERKKQEEAKQRAEEKRQREQEEARRREEAKRRADEQKRQQDEAEKARLAEERRRQEETRLSEEKRRAQEAARLAEVERKKSEELIAKNKIDEEKRRTAIRSWMLDQMKSGYTSAPTYSDGDFWSMNVIENFTVYDSRALKGVYELRYSDKRFQVVKEKQPVSANEAPIAVLFALVGRGRYMGGQYLKFPLNIGQKWSHKYESVARGSRAVLSWDAETAVKGAENITTLAGKFWVFKIIREAWSHRGSKATCTYYYSPEAKSIIKMLCEFPSGTRSVEVIKFGFPQQKSG
jgi:hypothetical protein